MTNEQSIELARCYYEILRNRVAIANLEKKSLEDFHTTLSFDMDCMNFDSELFDVNYGNICATIAFRDGAIKLIRSVEIWDEYDIIYEDYRFAN